VHLSFIDTLLITTANMGLIDLLQQKIELFRLEQRYTRGRKNRSTFVSEAQYVNGEYIYSPSSSYSSKHTARSDEREVPESPVSAASKGSAGSSNGDSDRETKKARRVSRIGWGSTRQEKRQSRFGIQGVEWDGSARS